MNAIALVPKAVMESDLKGFFEDRCSERGISLDFHCITGDCSKFKPLFHNYQNVIAWNCRLPHSWLTKDGKNVLFIENSLLHQGAGIFVDHGGFYSKSNLCREKTWQNIHEVDLGKFTKRFFKWEPGQGGSPDGPILVCLQNALDANLRQEFPLGNGHEDRLKVSIEVINKHLPRKTEVILRPSPRFLDWWKEHSASYPIRPEWKVDWSGKFVDVVVGCRAMVTVNSTCASEAATLGIPVATLGTGAFTGSGVSLECAHHPERLRDILDWEPPSNAGFRFGSAILGRHFMAYHDPRSTEEFERWLERSEKGLSSNIRLVKSASTKSSAMPDPETAAALQDATSKLEAALREKEELSKKVEALEAPELGENDHKVLQTVMENEDGVFYHKLPELTGLSSARIRYHVDALEKRGFVATHNDSPRDPFRIKHTKQGVDYAVRNNLI